MKCFDIEKKIEELENVDVMYIDEYNDLSQINPKNIYDPYLDSFNGCMVCLDDYKRLMEIVKLLTIKKIGKKLDK